MINVALLTETLAHIEANPGEWKQTTYRCGTAMCFAGWAVQLAGGRWFAEPGCAMGEALIAEPGDTPTYQAPDGSGRLVWVGNRAQRVLGLSDDQAADLFDADNSLPRLRELVAELCEEAA